MFPEIDIASKTVGVDCDVSTSGDPLSFSQLVYPSAIRSPAELNVAWRNHGYGYDLLGE
jgi:hypothetical protein